MSPSPLKTRGPGRRLGSQSGNAMYRHSVNKHASAKSFRNKVGTTKRINVAPPPMRGGFRL